MRLTKAIFGASLLASILLCTKLPADSKNPAQILECTPSPSFNHCLRVSIIIPETPERVWPLMSRIDQMQTFFPDFSYAATNASFFAPGVTYLVTYEPFNAVGIYEITAATAGALLAGRQLGQRPLKAFNYRHHLYANNTGTLSDEIIEYSLPFGLIGRVANTLTVRRRLSRSLIFAHERLRDLAAQASSVVVQ